MFKPNRSNGRPPSSSNQNTSARISKILRRVLDSVLLTVLAAVVVYAAFLAVKVNRGYSQTQDAPDRLVRLQIVDGSGESGMTRRVRQLLKDRSDEELAVVVVEAKGFDQHKVPHSFMIAREEDRSSAESLARRLGLDPEEVTYRVLDNNRFNVTATLVVGSDGLPEMIAEES
ncbi:MAG: LytR C-terminal domain-containing protein [bacterium]|nr:LytR C-terminal domain-containing protein [bacterium]